MKQTEAQKRYYSANAETIRRKRRETHKLKQEDPEYRKAAVLRAREWALNNQQRKKESDREWIDNHKERAKEQRMKWAHTNSDKVAQIQREWHSRNPGKKSAWGQDRRMRIKNIGGSVTAQEWEDIKNKFGHKCLCCGKSEIDYRMAPHA